MPKNVVSDPITDQEISFAHLILSGTMTDRRAAEDAGLNPDTAAYTKAKPRVRAYMIEHRATVKEKLVDQEVEELRKLNIGRDQVLNRLWELAALSHEQTRGSIAGQIKALSMIAAIEGLIPDRRFSPHATKPAGPAVEPDIYKSEWLREQQHQTAAKPGDPIATTEPPAAPSGDPKPEPRPNSTASAADPHSDPTPDRNSDQNQPGLPAPILPQASNWVPQATGSGFDALVHAANSLRQPFSIQKGRFGRRR